jgi:hypothetical protein
VRNPNISWIETQKKSKKMQGQTKNSHPIGRLQYEDMFCIEK